MKLFRTKLGLGRSSGRAALPILLLLAVPAVGWGACPSVVNFKGSYSGGGQRFNADDAAAGAVLVSSGLATMSFDGKGTATRRGIVSATFIEKSNKSRTATTFLASPSTPFKFFYTYDPATCLGRIDTGVDGLDKTVLGFTLSDSGAQMTVITIADDSTSDQFNLDSQVYYLRKQ